MNTSSDLTHFSKYSLIIVIPVWFSDVDLKKKGNNIYETVWMNYCLKYIIQKKYYHNFKSSHSCATQPRSCASEPQTAL